MRSYHLFFLITILATINFSCKKEASADFPKPKSLGGGLPSFTDLLAVHTGDYKGAIVIESHGTNFNTINNTIQYKSDFSGSSYVSSQSANFVIGSTSFPLDTSSLTSTGLSSYFGNTNTVKFMSGLTLVGASSNFYMPSILSASLTPGQTLSKTGTITWNGDSNNVNGVYILATYYPSANPTLSTPSSTTSMLVQTDDDGSYTFSASDFGSIPSNSNVTLKILRGNYKVLTINNEKYLLVGGSFTGGFIYLTN